ncbi:hypothetical protein EB796_001680 [Bugula neritina]|uniref:Uncharacterized protein n=1 Tax=Bugula neritina TaxID=10212 RepID=A0A7J7KPJ3_BUGNE|nr:hypothetical protein EB796_001680 [Bugula neritina]
MLAKDKRELAAFKVANKENKPSHNINQSTKLQLPRRSSSIDSITGEYNRHFKPIVRYPRTPPRPSDKEKGYPETIKVTPCPQTVKRLDFASSSSPAPDVSSSNEKCGSNSSTTHSRVKDESIVKEGASIPSCSTSADHTFLRPRHSSCLSADDHSNDGMSIVSSSTGTSMSNSQLRIATTSPIIPDSPGDTVGRSRTSSNNTSERWSPCSTESRKVNRHTRSKQHRDSTKNGYVNTKSSKTLTNGHTNGTAASSSASGARKRRVSRSSSAQSTISYRSEDFNQNVNGEVGMANGSHDSSGPAFVDPDELYAKKLQQIYKMEKRYCMPTLRFEGSGNEYNTRKRKRDELRN